MKGKILALAICIVMLSSCFQVGGLQTSIDEKKCNCENTLDEEYVGLTDEEFEELQNQITENGWSFTIAENSATQYSIDKLCGFIQPENTEDDNDFNSQPLNMNLPDEFDWSNPDKNYKERKCTTPVRNQGNCGSCWAFATIAPLESAILIKDAVSEDLSEQWLVSCNTNRYGCDGGRFAYQWLAGTEGLCGGTGAVYETDFPYTATDGSCGSYYPHVYLVKDYGYVGGASSVPGIQAIKQKIYDYGPVSATVWAGDLFGYYDGGIFDANEEDEDYSDGYQDINHAVVLVGWKDDSSIDSGGYWIIRNSWADGWGEDGYMRMAYHTSSHPHSNIGYGATYIDGYKRIGGGDVTVDVYIEQITNQGDSYDPIDPIGAREPEWYYKVYIGSEYSEINENLKKEANGIIWPWDWVSEFTWNVRTGHISYVDEGDVDVKIEVWDNDLFETDDQADITPKSGRTFTGKYDLVTDELFYNDDDEVPTEGDYYSIVGTADDNAKIKFDVTDSYDASDYIPNLGVNPSSINFGKKGQGTYTETLTILNTADVDPFGWADDLDWTASDDKTWITLSTTSGSLGATESDPITVTVDANNLGKGQTHSGTITIESNGGTKTVDVSIRIQSKAKEKPLLLMPGFLQRYFPNIFILLEKIVKI